MKKNGISFNISTVVNEKLKETISYGHRSKFAEECIEFGLKMYEKYGSHWPAYVDMLKDHARSEVQTEDNKPKISLGFDL